MKNRIAATTLMTLVAAAFCLPVTKTYAAPAVVPTAAPVAVAAVVPTAVSPAKAAPVASVIVASVGNDKLTSAELNRTMAAIKASDKSLQSGSEQAKKTLASWRQSQIENWVNSRLLVREAARRKIVASPAALNRLMKNARASFATPAAFNAFLKSGGQSEAGLRKFYSEQLALDELSKRLAVDITISDAAIQKFYDAPSDDFEIPNQARAHHILLKVPLKATAAEKAKVRARAVDILQKAQAPGADFDALVKQYSEDEGMKYDGGDTGQFSLDEALPPMKPFAEAVFKAQSGQIIGPIETVFGFHIVRVDEASHKPALDRDLKKIVRSFLVKQQVQQKLDAIAAEAKKSGVVKING